MAKKKTSTPVSPASPSEKEVVNSPLLGVHVSTSGGLHTAFERAEQLKINTFQLFVKNNKQWFAADLEEEEIELYKEAHAKWKGGPLVAHGCYLLNIGSANPELQEKSRKSFKAELLRANTLGVDHFVFHPGAHTGHGEEVAIANIIQALDAIHEETPECKTLSVLEITAGQGSSVGCKFEHLERVLNAVKHKDRVAVCLDTCHMFAAGYDIRSEEAWHKSFEEFEKRIGFGKLVCIHTNDSKKGLNSRVDRHEHIGSGEIGKEGFRLLMTDPRFQNIPKILETPKDKNMTEDFANLAILREMHKPSTEMH